MVTFSKTVARIFNTPRLYELAKDILEGNRTNAQNLILVFYKDDPLETFEALFQVKISRFGPEDSLCLIIYNGRHTNNKNRDSSTRYPSTA